MSLAIKVLIRGLIDKPPLTTPFFQLKIKISYLFEYLINSMLIQPELIFNIKFRLIKKRTTKW